MKNLITALLACSILSCTGHKHEQEQNAISPNFTSDPESFREYRYPDWFRDAKFGIWSHWDRRQFRGRVTGMREKCMNLTCITVQPTSPPESQAGNTFIILNTTDILQNSGIRISFPLWKAEKWDPEKLMALYKSVGARYFVSMATHHDNFFLWDSKIHRWNSVKMGPQKDVVGLWQQAAQKEGLKFGISEHLGASYTWFQPSHRSDPSGPMKGVPYDGAES